VVINDQDDKTRMAAIEWLSSMNDNWDGCKVNTSLEKGTMLIYG
jgi:hypothetical protein